MNYSRQRQAILDYLSSVRSHPTAETVYLEVKKSIPNISLGTVYRNLARLADENVISRVTCGNVERFDATTEAHAHFVCDKCGEVTDLNGIDLSLLPMPDETYAVKKAELVFKGTCNKCR